MKQKIKWFSLLMLIVAVLGGCSQSVSENPSETAVLTEESKTDDIEIEEEEGLGEPDNSWPKQITDDAGNTVILEKKPERIAILHSAFLEYFFLLETPPTASTGASIGNAMKVMKEWETLKPYRESGEIIDLGSARELNLEAVLEAEPDVIVTFKGHVDNQYEQLIEIAPVIQIDFSHSWQEQLMLCAQIAGQERLAENTIKETESVLSEAKEKLSQHQDKTVALFRTGGKDFISRGNKEYYELFGICKPEGYPDTYETLSLEAVAEMNPDYIIFQEYLELSQTFVSTQESSSVWQSLNAVNQGNIIYFDDSLNTFGPLALRLTAEKLVQIFED